MGVRRLLSLVANLPPGCEFDAARNGASARWGASDELLAVLIDAVRLHHVGWLRSRGVDAEQPEPIRTPWTPEPAPPEMNTGAELAGFLSAPVTYQGG